MKRIVRIIALAIAFVTGLTTVSAQTVQVFVHQKVPTLPTAASNYMDDPFRYFNIQIIANGVGAEGVDVFFDIKFWCTTSDFYIKTKANTLPAEPIHLSQGANQIGRDQMMSQLRGRKETNINFSNPLNAQQLPEGTYELCLDVYLWSDQLNPARVPISIGAYPSFEMCYSGSAPELVFPMAGAQMTLNGSMVVTPRRKINFFWTPVISNCSNNRARFKYQLKVVKVINGQNYQDAINRNPVAFSTEVRNANYAVFDTLRDIKVQLERGALYVAQVKAEQIKSGRDMDNFNIANDGKSQPMPFFWDTPNESWSWMNVNPGFRSSNNYGYIVDDESEEGDEEDDEYGLTQWEGGVEVESGLETIIDEMKEQYLASFILDDATVESLTEAYPEEKEYVPTPKRRYIESDGYYTVDMTDDWDISFMPSRHESLQDVSYDIELFDFLDGDIDYLTTFKPVHSETIEDLPESYSQMDSHELVSRHLAGWGSNLKQGRLYYLRLTSNFTVEYWTHEIADTSFYVNGMLAEHIHDTLSSEFKEERVSYSNGVVLQWGDDPEEPSFATPQWKAPVDRTGDDVYDPASYWQPASIPEVTKDKTFPVYWNPVKKVDSSDEVEYEVTVYELKPGQTWEEAVASNKVLVSRTVTDSSGIYGQDTDFFKVFSANKTYVMTLSTDVSSEDNVYHFKNGNEALPIIFTIVK